MSNFTTVNNTTPIHPEDIDICEHGAFNGFQQGYFAPIFAPDEWDWDPGLRGFLYFIGMFWSFLGVSIIADIFMGSIETITSSYRKVVVSKGKSKRGKVFYVRVWNDTVANLTLMALGSSAPEIMLSVIEIIGARFYAGPLGPSTIVGSAAFNLFVIIGVCVFSVGPQGAQTKDVPVFWVTAFYSIFAYGWMVIVLYASSPQVVELWEGVLTFVFFFVLVITAYMMGVREKLCRCKKKSSKVTPHRHLETSSLGPGRLRQVQQLSFTGGANEEVTQDEVYAIVKSLRQDKPDLHHDDLVEMAVDMASKNQKKSRAFHRVNASRLLAGGNQLQTFHDIHARHVAAEKAARALALRQAMKAKNKKRGKPRASVTMRRADGITRTESAVPTSTMSVQFDHDLYGVHESESAVEITVTRHALPGANIDLSRPLELLISTRSVTEDELDEGSVAAQPDQDFVPLDCKEIVIPAGESEVSFQIQLNNNKEFEEVEEFAVILSLENFEVDGMVYSLPSAETVVRIYDDRSPGLLQFHYRTRSEQSKQAFIVCESEKKVIVSVRRHGGSLGTLKCQYQTRNGSAVTSDDMNVADYIAAEGELEFGPGEVSKHIEIEIVDDQQYERDENFFVDLTDVEFIPEPTLEDVESPQKDDNNSPQAAEKRPLSSSLTQESVPKGWTGFDPLADGTPQSSVSTEIVIISDERERIATDKIVGMLAVNRDRVAVGHSNYKMQFLNALYPGGYTGFKNKEHLQNSGCSQCMMWSMHIFTLPWKVLFALVPPTDFCGGYLAFFLSLLFIAVLTMLISDMASMFGCIIGFDPGFTAITFVALGTSLPDLFASRSAAMHDKYADASIGNITGSNSVNVFLGLGLPWFIAAIYWAATTDEEVIFEWKERYLVETSRHYDSIVAERFLVTGHPEFVVKAGNLVFSVIVFCTAAVICLATLEARRYIKCCGNVELGGPAGPKWATGIFFIILWVLYILISWLNVAGYIPNLG